MFGRLYTIIALFLLVTIQSFSQDSSSYFPKDAFKVGEMDQWLSENLNTSWSGCLGLLAEPVLYTLNDSSEVYRLVCSGGLFVSKLFSMRIELEKMKGILTVRTIVRTIPPPDLFSNPNNIDEDSTRYSERKRKLTFFEVCKLLGFFSNGIKELPGIRMIDGVYPDFLGCLDDCYYYLLEYKQTDQYKAIMRGSFTKDAVFKSLINYIFKLGMIDPNEL